jgi:hypothetical protein
MKVYRSRSVTTLIVRRLDNNGMYKYEAILSSTKAGEGIRLHVVRGSVLHFVHVGMKLSRFKGNTQNEGVWRQGAEDMWT